MHICKYSSYLQMTSPSVAGKIFTYIPINVSWADARKYCWTQGAELATITTVEENNALATSIQSTFWIGMNDVTTENTWVWADGSLSGYRIWQSGEPNNAGNEDCTVIMSVSGVNAGLWNDVACSLLNGFVCSQCLNNASCVQVRQHATAVMSDRVACHDATVVIVFWKTATWLLFHLQMTSPTRPDKVFHYYSMASTWSVARSYCLATGGDIATIANPNEVSSLQTNLPWDPWFGLNDLATEGTYVWADGSNNTYRNWNTLQPDNANNEDCVSYVAATSSRWYDYNCSLSRGFLCAKCLNGLCFQVSQKMYYAIKLAQCTHANMSSHWQYMYAHSATEDSLLSEGQLHVCRYVCVCVCVCLELGILIFASNEVCHLWGFAVCSSGWWAPRLFGVNFCKHANEHSRHCDILCMGSATQPPLHLVALQHAQRYVTMPYLFALC